MKNISKYIKSYVNLNSSTLENVDLQFTVRMEGRTSNDDMTEALRFRLHDPLWMLARQWQLGEFRGNDCGTAMSVSCSIKEDDCKNAPLEPMIEQINPKIDWMVRIESAVYLMDMLRYSKTVSRKEIRKFRDIAIQKWPIEWEKIDNYMLGHEATREYEQNLNSRRIAYMQTYRGKIFDGYKLYTDITDGKKNSEDIFATISDHQIKCEYTKWFKQKYLPTESINQHWQHNDLCYQLEDVAGNYQLEGDRYQGGRISWYSVDYKNTLKNTPCKTITRKVMSLPTIAHFAAAPNRRLWQIEDHKVFMGNSLQKQSSGNIAMMKYLAMFSNDWMLFPLDTELGKYIQVDSIDVVDTFGDKIRINGDDRAGKKDGVQNQEEKWQIFTNTTIGNPQKTDIDGLYFAPQLANTLESKPIE